MDVAPGPGCEEAQAEAQAEASTAAPSPPKGPRRGVFSIAVATARRHAAEQKSPDDGADAEHRADGGAQNAALSADTASGSAVVVAAQEGNSLKVLELLRARADPSGMNLAGETALFDAGYSGRLDMVTHLLLFSADPRHKSRLGMVAMQVTSCNLCKAVLRVFEAGNLAAEERGPGIAEMEKWDAVAAELPEPARQLAKEHMLCRRASAAISAREEEEERLTARAQTPDERTNEADIFTAQVRPFTVEAAAITDAAGIPGLATALQATTSTAFSASHDDLRVYADLEGGIPRCEASKDVVAPENQNEESIIRAAAPDEGRGRAESSAAPGSFSAGGSDSAPAEVAMQSPPASPRTALAANTEVADLTGTCCMVPASKNEEEKELVGWNVIALENAEPGAVTQETNRTAKQMRRTSPRQAGCFRPDATDEARLSDENVGECSLREAPAVARNLEIERGARKAGASTADPLFENLHSMMISLEEIQGAQQANDNLREELRVLKAQKQQADAELWVVREAHKAAKARAQKAEEELEAVKAQTQEADGVFWEAACKATEDATQARTANQDDAGDCASGVQASPAHIRAIQALDEVFHDGTANSAETLQALAFLDPLTVQCTFAAVLECKFGHAVPLAGPRGGA